MSVRTFLTLLFLATLLSGCIVRPSHHPRKAKIVVPVQVTTVLDKEHSQQGIVVATVKPGAKRGCWTHKTHWHCKR